MTSFWTKAAVAAAERRARYDVMQAEVRAEAPARRAIRREPRPTPAAVIGTEDLLRLRLAEELEYARRLLERMGEALSSDGVLIARHLTTLQSVDIVGQMIGYIATVVRSSDPAGAIEGIGMRDLKAGLTRKSVV